MVAQAVLLSQSSSAAIHILMLVCCTGSCKMLSLPHVELTGHISCQLPSWGLQALGEVWLMLNLQMWDI